MIPLFCPQGYFAAIAYRRLKEAYANGALQLVKRIHALLALAQGQSVSEVADMMPLGEQTVRDYRNQFLLKGIATGGVNIGNAHAVLPQHCRKRPVYARLMRTRTR
jgi:hypothetical protein